MVEACPRCGYSYHVYTKVKQFPGFPGSSEIGFECPRCGEQWGFKT